MKYFLIDSNQFRHLYSPTEKFSDDIYSLICKLIDRNKGALLMPQQIIDEVERNRTDEWVKSEVGSLEKEHDGILKKSKEIRDRYSEYDSFENLAVQIDQHAVLQLESIKARKRAYTDPNSKPNKKFQKLCSKSTIIAETDEMYHKAHRRLLKKNPPYDEKIGDSLVWESVIEELSKVNKPELIIVSNDKKAWGEGAQAWLIKEFKDKTGGNIQFATKLSDIPTLTEEEQLQIKAAEEREAIENAINDFAQSSDYKVAGHNAERLLRYKQSLDEPDFVRIIDAARTNYSISHSWFTASPLKSLLEDTDNPGYALPQIEAVGQSEWRLFERKMQTGLRRQQDDSDDTDGIINLDDIPF